MSLILSKAAFAARHNVGSTAVSNWIARGRISGRALTPNGRINVEEAERQLGVTLDLSRSEGKIAAANAGAVAAIDNIGDPNAPVRSSVRERLLEVEFERKSRQLEEERGRYVLTDAIRREHTRELVQFIATVEQRLPDLVTVIAGLEPKAAVVAARRWWRSLRQDEADAARTRSASAPEFDEAPHRAAAAEGESAHAI